MESCKRLEEYANTIIHIFVLVYLVRLCMQITTRDNIMERYERLKNWKMCGLRKKLKFNSNIWRKIFMLTNIVKEFVNNLCYTTSFVTQVANLTLWI